MKFADKNELKKELSPPTDDQKTLVGRLAHFYLMSLTTRQHRRSHRGRFTSDCKMCPAYYNSLKVQLLETYNQIDLPIVDRQWPLSSDDLQQVDKRLLVGVPP